MFLAQNKGKEMNQSESPIMILNDDLVSQGASVVKSVFPNATDEECSVAASGAFMAILSEREGGDVLFGESEDGPFFRFPTKSQRASS